MVSIGRNIRVFLVDGSPGGLVLRRPMADFYSAVDKSPLRQNDRFDFLDLGAYGGAHGQHHGNGLAVK